MPVGKNMIPSLSPNGSNTRRVSSIKAPLPSSGGGAGGESERHAGVGLAKERARAHMSAQKRTARCRVTRSASPRVVDGSSSLFLVVERCLEP